MKKHLLLIVLFCASLMSVAQDVIVKKDGTTIQSKVLEISETEIKYKKWSNQEGPLYSIRRSLVDSINYQNGEVELIASETNDNLPSSYNYGKMERDGRNLVLNGRKIYGEEIRFLVGEQNYQTYLGARKQMGTGDLFGLIFWPSLGVSVTMIASAYIWPTYNYNYGYYSPNQGKLKIGCMQACSPVSLRLLCSFLKASEKADWIGLRRITTETEVQARFRIRFLRQS